MNEFLQKVRKTLNYYLNKVLLSLRLLRFQVSPVILNRPIFVVGCSRAGTTLVYKTLSESKQLGTIHKETHDFWASLHPIEDRSWESHEIPESLSSRNDVYIVSRFFYSQTGRSRVVDKNNQNGLSIPYLFKLFPDAHFIYIKRKPGDNINSLIHGWNKADEFATWSAQLPEDVNIDAGKNKRWCFFLAKGWRNYINAPLEQACAFQYQAMNSAILKAKSGIPTEQWHEISYETLIDAPVREFEAIFQACGLSFDPQVRQHCQKVLQKPYNTFSEIKVDKWQTGKNKDKIQKVLADVQTIATEMGY